MKSLAATLILLVSVGAQAKVFEEPTSYIDCRLVSNGISTRSHTLVQYSEDSNAYGSLFRVQKFLTKQEKSNLLEKLSFDSISVENGPQLIPSARVTFGFAASRQQASFEDFLRGLTRRFWVRGDLIEVSCLAIE